jgi:molybdopterin synthase sulfur carrier subunit
VIAVRFFASLRDAVGLAEVSLAPPELPSDLDALLGLLRHRLDGEAYAAITAVAVRIAVNQTLVEGNITLGLGDEVAFLPPVTGG